MTADKIREACRIEISELEAENNTLAANALRQFVAQADDDMMHALANVIRKHDPEAGYGVTKALMDEMGR